VRENSNPSIHPKNPLAAASLLLCAMVVALGFPLSSHAQATGYISGTVTDKTGAAVVGAEVVISNAAGSQTRTTITNSEGAYVVAGLQSGKYNIEVTAKGFQKYSAQNVVLDVAEKIRVDVQLTVGAVTEEVVVTGENVAQVQTTSSEIGGTVTGKQIDQLILNGRNFSQLVTIVPGVVSQTGQDEGTVGVYGNVSYSMNGGRSEYNNWELDGGDNMDNGSNTTLNVYPNIEAIAEFKVLTSNYGAQYGKNGSGTVEVETKSGGSSFHGSAFEYLRNEMFNARPWESGADPAHPNPTYKKHDFGYTVGGPIFIPHHYNAGKKKTFFFFSEEWRREKTPHAYNVKVPSDPERGLVGGNQTNFGNFSDLCPGPDCPNVADPTAVPIDPNALLLLAVVPRSNTTNGGFPAYATTASYPTSWREELVRVDHNFGDNYRLTIRYIHDSWKTIVPGPLWGNSTASFPNVQTNFVGPGTSFVARLTANITPTLLNEFVASYTGNHIFLTTNGPTALPSGFTMPPIFANGFEGKLPSFHFSGNGAYGGIADGQDLGNDVGVDTGYFPWKNANPTYTYRDNVTKITGNHTLQFGAYFAAAQKNQENSLNQQGILTFDAGAPVSTGNSFADLLLGNISSYSQAKNQLFFYDRYKILEPYFQDDWRVTKKLTLNLGLRWSVFGRYQEKHNFEFAMSPSPANWISGNAPLVDPNSGAFVTDTNGVIISQGGINPGDPFNGYIQCGATGVATGCMQNKWLNPAPRIGFAWDPKGDGKMAIRGGYGIFFEHQNGNEANAESLQGGASPLVLISTQENISGFANVGGGGASSGPSFPLSPISIPGRAAWPYVQQWNLNVQRELPQHFVVSVAYVGSKGTHLALQRDLNQVPKFTGTNPFSAAQPLDPGGADCANFSTDASGFPTGATLGNGAAVPSSAVTNLWIACQNNADPFRPFLGYGTINRIENTANSIYHALQATARRDFGGLTLSLAYTYSHSIDDSSDRYDSNFVDSYNPHATRANSSFDMRHNLAISYVYALPLLKGPGLTHSLLGNWSLSGIMAIQTGTPFTVSNGTTYGDNAGVGNGVGTSSFPDVIGNPHSVSSSDKSVASAVTGPLYYNPGAYALPTGLTFGNSGRNTLYLPGRVNFDLGVFKRFPIKEKSAIEFRWESYNLFNHTQFSAINSTMDCTGENNSAGDPVACLASSSFLHLTAAHAPRRMQFGLRFQF
jgi:hypothetical protein